MSDTRRIKIFDTTLRDGEQSPGCSMNLAREAGGRPGARRAGRRHHRSRLSRSPRPATSRRSARSPARSAARPSAAWPAATTPTSTAPGRPSSTAQQPRIHVFLATSAIHREFKLKMTREEIVARAVAGVKRAVGYCDDVEFSPEDAARTELDFLCQVVEAAIDAGATTVNIPDTVGYATPPHIRQRRSRRSKNRVPNIDKAVDQHALPQRPGPGRRQQPGRRRRRRRADRMHDQRHRRAGRQLLARRSRDGDADAARLLPLHDRHQHASGSCPPAGWSRSITGMHVQRNKAIVGRNAFAHEAGIHQDGMLKERRDLRDHAARGRRLHADRPGAGQAQRPGRPGRPGQGPGLPAHAASSSRRCSTTSRSWPTRRRTSTTATSSP